MPFKPHFTITNSITAALTKIERARGFLDAAKISEEWIFEMQARALVLEAHHTTHIEGTELTLEQSEKILSGKKVKGTDPDDVRELLNYRNAFELVAEYLGSGDPITEGLIREIHKRLVLGVRGNTAKPGEYRKIQNYVMNSQTGKAVYIPPPAQDVPPMMTELVRWINTATEINPVLQSAIAQFQFVHIHPFVDGNGRTGRLLSTLCLYRTGYDFKRLFTISEYYDRNRAAYYQAIQSVRESGMDLTLWLEYFTGGLAIQMEEVKERGSKIMKRDLIAQKHRLSERQRLALGYLLEKDGMTIEDYASLCPQVTRRTLQREIKGMIEKGLLTAEGATRNLYYRLSQKF